MATAEANDLITEVTQLPVQPGAAMRLLWMLEDPRTSAADLGRLIESDPALSTQVIRLANTAFYGLSGKVASAWRAVTVLGLATVRALATTAAFDLFSEKGRSVPDAASLGALQIPADAEASLLEEVSGDKDTLAGFLTVRG